jgi:hypothetical protein
MSIKLYKPNFKNTGSLFSFEIGEGYKDKSPTLYIKALHQHHWDESKHIGSFSEYAKRENGQLVYPEHNISIKMSEFEVGSIIDVLEHGGDWNGFHSSNVSQDKTGILFYQKVKQVAKKYKDEKGQIAEKQVDVYGFGLILTRNVAEKFMIYIEPGEAVVLKQLLLKYLSRLEDFRSVEDKKHFSKKGEYQQQDKEEISQESSEEPLF